MKHKFAAFSALAFASLMSVANAQTPTPLPAERSAMSAFKLTFAGGSYLGVQTVNVTSENAAKYNLREPRGVAVTKVIENSPAAKAGLLAGDVILRFDGEDVKSEMKLTRLIQEVAPDQKAKLTILRGGSEQEITVTMGKRAEPSFRTFGNGVFIPPTPEQQQLLRVPPTLPEGFEMRRLPGSGDNLFYSGSSGRRLGVMATPLSKQLGEYFGAPDGKGLLIEEVKESSAAAKAGLKAGDVILEIDGEAISNQGDLLSTINKKAEGDVTLTILRDKQRQSVRVTPESKK